MSANAAIVKMDAPPEATWAYIRLRQLRSNIRRNVLRSAGRKAARIILKKVKDEPKGEATGTLQKSLKAKVKAYAANDVAFVVAGAKSQSVAVTQYKDYRTGRMRTWLKPRKKGPKMENPAKIAHFAGPKRKGLFVKRVMNSTFGEVSKVIMETIEQEVFRR